VGFVTIPSQNKTVYYSEDKAKLGQMQYGKTEIKGKTYYFDTFDGAMKTGVFYNKETGTLQYYGNNGQMNYGNVVINGKVYTFDAAGNYLGKGNVTIDGHDYYLGNNNQVLVGFQKISNNTYYYNKDKGQKEYGQKNIDGSWYMFDDKTGVMKTGFVTIPSQNKTVYYGNNGQMQYGQRNIDGHWYNFDTYNGAMKTGLVYIPEQNKTVYYGSNGQMQYGWQTINNKKYYFDTFNGAMKTGTVNINGKNYTFNSDGTLKQDTWGWPFPSVGQGSFTGAQLFGVNPGGEFRMNGFHDGLDFGSYDHPGSSVHAVHSGVVTQIGYIAGLENYVVVQSDEYSFVYQEAFSNRGNIKVYVGQQINTGDVIGYRDTSHLHLGITREKNIMRAIANSFNNNGTWLNPLELIRNGIANQ
ncbi:peptidoglycan DD-metalloendopeptidase family protein, partial [Ligilactobacillus salivarius]